MYLYDLPKQAYFNFAYTKYISFLSDIQPHYIETIIELRITTLKLKQLECLTDYLTELFSTP